MLYQTQNNDWKLNCVGLVRSSFVVTWYIAWEVDVIIFPREIVDFMRIFSVIDVGGKGGTLCGGLGVRVVDVSK